MAGGDSFDLLEQLGDKSKVEQLKAKIEKKSSSDVLKKLDQIEADIENAVSESRSTEEVVDGIIKANFESLNGDVEAAEEDLQELMLHLRAMLDSAGGEFAKLQELNPDELAIVEKAKAAQKNFERLLGNAQNLPAFANIWFGMKNRRISRYTKELAEAEAAIKVAEEESSRMYRDRLKNADIQDSLDRIITQVSGMVNIIESMLEETEAQIDALKTRKEIAFDTKEKAATVMEERQKELVEVEARLKAAELEFEELQNGSPEQTEQQKKIADLRELRTETKGKYNIALGIFQSKERFVDQIVVHLEAQTTTKNNLKQLIGQLKSDTEERITTYESGLQLIQSATAQEAASIYEEAGVKTDQKITEIAAKVLVSSEKDRIDRVKKHPERMAELHKVLVAMAQATAKYKAEDAELAEKHREKYGIDVGKEFSFRYEGEGGESAGSDGSKKSGSGDVNDLLD